MPTVNAFSWNPKRPQRLAGKRFRRLQRINNFGDLLGPLIVERLMPPRGRMRQVHGFSRTKLLTVGSVLHFARNGDCVWGSGVNGKVDPSEYHFTSLDVRAVRGPLTRRHLQERGIAVPAVYGDPALLIPALFPEVVERAQTKQHALTIVPNLNDWRRFTGDRDQLMDPTGDVWTCINRIAASDLVVGSSLHGIVVAEALGIPARLVLPGQESLFKYHDYYEGTGRTGIEFAHSVEEAVDLGGAPGVTCDLTPLRAAFPSDLWERKSSRYATEVAVDG